MFQSSSNFKTAATEYGLSREKQAREIFAQKKSAMNSHFHDCGLVVNNEFPFLAATPDGKICENGECGLGEIKCPYLARDMLISEACVEINKFMLIEQNGKVSLDKNHDYYIQVQGQLLVTGAPWCDFVVYITKDMFIERILPDIPFMTCMLLKLSLFYKYYAVSFMQKK